ncbi:MAG TPA: rhodanese-related sulfurtransferase [Bacteroidia bacterium]|nr:rhodanese-related sulfurtransferase [Bacteroidia bacterium]
MSALYNKVSRAEMRRRLMAEDFQRITLSFYRYVIIGDPVEMRNTLWREWTELNVFGRVYIAREGINAQISVPEQYFETFRRTLYAHPEFENVPFKIAVEDNGKSFFLLAIKVKKKIVADGLKDDSFDVTNVGKHLTAVEFNEAMETPGVVVVDMRNHYESEVGHFENAILPQADTFKDELPMVLDELKGKENNKILMYCTGGIRCEKASAFLRHHGFRDVNQLYGGIIEYARQVKQTGLPSKFRGKNFVFDERLGERITDEVIAHCHQCGASADTHVNCANPDCHVLFIQCSACGRKFEGYCSGECRNWAKLPEAEREKLKKEGKIVNARALYHSRLRPAFGSKW